MKVNLSNFIIEFNKASLVASKIATSKGFKDQHDNPTRIALIHSELSECLEALRHPLRVPDKYCQDFYNDEIELADAVIRCMDMTDKNNWNLGKAIVAKLKFNTTRPHKHGGKKF